MNLIVRFRSGVNGGAVCAPSRSVGLEFVDQVRRNYGDISIEIITSYLNCASYDPECSITEDLARKSGLFSDSCAVNITVPRASLNPFLSIVGVRKEEKFKAEWKLDEATILRLWEDAGFPAEWKPPSDQLRVEVARARAKGKAV